ncbi:MAG: pyridoxamine kinase [Lachnospiraceae bacterium]|jgi:pyridoxine kinase|nr:pyridoxamine kinase [Lachnospiraceae bacterium]MEE3460505.1 pyridoxamine kinase [Lachnospiraceae bacterium]
MKLKNTGKENKRNSRALKPSLPDHNRQKKVAVINDLTGFGRCSLAVAIPIISKLRVQCCWVPTAILSNHTGFESYFIDDYTRHFDAYAGEWKKLGLKFNAISTGFLGSAEQVRHVVSFIEDFRDPDTFVIVDPVMGDYGKLYSSYTPEMCLEMKKLVRYADIITPNLTEACILTDTDYHDGHWKLKELKILLKKLYDLGPERIVITGITQGEFVASMCYDGKKDYRLTRQYRVGEQRNGTGDVFSAIITADAVNGVDFLTSVKKASRFVKRCILKSGELGIPVTDGVAFEEVLDSLH